MQFSKSKGQWYPLSILIVTTLLFSACGAGEGQQGQPVKLRKVSVMTVEATSATINTDYPARIEGKVNVDIRSQADGYIERIFVDEGTYVKAGQSLFKINDRPLVEQLNTAKAVLNAAKASLTTATLEVEKYQELSKNNVVSDFQLRASKAAYENAKATVAQSAAAVESARINLEFALIKAPVSGYIGRIPKRIGNLVTKNDAQPLTTLSDVQEVYAYFSMTEKDFLRFTTQNPATNFKDKVASMPPVQLLLANGNPYLHAGKIQMIDGQFDNATGAITVRAIFNNAEGILRSGNTGRLVLPEHFTNVILVPVLATLDVQNKIFVYRLTKDNHTERIAIEITGKSGDNYLVTGGLKSGDKILTKDINLIQEGEQIIPK